MAAGEWRRSPMAVTVGGAGKPFLDAICAKAADRVTGNGLEQGVQMGPVISPDSRARIEGIIDAATEQGAKAVVDRRRPNLAGYAHGNFIRTTVLDSLPLSSDLVCT